MLRRNEEGERGGRSEGLGEEGYIPKDMYFAGE